MSDTYLRQVLAAHAVNNGPSSPAHRALASVWPLINAWGGQQILWAGPSGSFAKGTAIRTGTDIDLFVSLSSTTAASLGDIYHSLFTVLNGHGFKPRAQNVSIGIRVGAHDVDVVPGKRQAQHGSDHSLYSNRTGTWLQTNVDHHIAYVHASNRLDEIRLLKVWRNKRGLDFPSFYLELAVIHALYGKWSGRLAANVVTALAFLRDELASTCLVDPANTNNVVSESLSLTGRRVVAGAARAALASNWEAEFA